MLTEKDICEILQSLTLCISSNSKVSNKYIPEDRKKKGKFYESQIMGL